MRNQCSKMIVALWSWLCSNCSKTYVWFWHFSNSMKYVLLYIDVLYLINAVWEISLCLSPLWDNYSQALVCACARRVEPRMPLSTKSATDSDEKTKRVFLWLEENWAGSFIQTLLLLSQKEFSIWNSFSGKCQRFERKLVFLLSIGLVDRLMYRNLIHEPDI